jgi:hypothetical protein
MTRSALLDLVGVLTVVLIRPLRRPSLASMCDIA